MKVLHNLGKLLILGGILLILAGSILLVPERFPLSFFGKLPGDISYHKRNISIFVPFTSMIIVSLIITVILTLFSRWHR